MTKWTTAVLVAVVCATGLGAQSQQEGLRVRGQWVIDIREPDGTLLRRVEFENALRARGQSVLASLLTGQASAGLWAISIGGYNNQELCYNTSLEDVECRIDPPESSVSPLPYRFKNLTIVDTTERVGVPSGTSLVLSGSATIAIDGSIASVSTSLGICASTVTPELCDSGQAVGNNAPDFTSHSLSPPVPVSAGQIVQVKVTLTFS
jgi:hypothetical protein